MAGEEGGGTVSVGYALRAKREKSFMLPELLEEAANRGVSFRKIDPDTDLESQGPFDLILHKLDGDAWAKNLQNFSKNHPEVVIVDNYDAVHQLDDRRSMLKAVEQLDPATLGAEILVPKQLTIESNVKASDLAALLQKEDFHLPAVSKPIAANGTHSSHSLALVLTPSSLQHLEPPVVLQEFVNHGGVLFKLYILGEKVMVFRRHSLPDITEPEVSATLCEAVIASLEKKERESASALAEPQKEQDPAPDPEVEAEKSGLVELNRISNVHLTAEELQDDRVTDPPPELMRSLGMSLKQLLGLHAFNVDILREGGHGERYYIVDINYMPGYERMPDFPSLIIDFFKQRVEARMKALAAKECPIEPVLLLRRELSVPVTFPPIPYPVLQGKKKWVYFKAAMKLCGLEHRSRKPQSIE